MGLKMDSYGIFFQSPPVRRDLKPSSVCSQRNTDFSGGGRRISQTFANLDMSWFFISFSSALMPISPTVLSSSPGSAKRSNHQKPGTHQSSSGFQGSNQRPAPHSQPSHKKPSAPRAPIPAQGIQSLSNRGGFSQEQDPCQTPQVQGSPQRSPHGQRSAGGQGSTKKKPFIPMQQR